MVGVVSVPDPVKLSEWKILTAPLCLGLKQSVMFSSSYCCSLQSTGSLPKDELGEGVEKSQSVPPDQMNPRHLPLAGAANEDGS